jgi:hypothetical protein
MQDFLGRTVKIGDYLFGGIGYGNVIWIITNTADKENTCMAKLVGNSNPINEISVDIKLNQFIKISEAEVMLYKLQE